MCWTCFKQYTDKPVYNFWVYTVYQYLRDQGEHWERLHHIIDDMNVDDVDFQINLEDIEDHEWQAYKMLLSLTEAERATAVAMYWGYILPNGSLRKDLK